MKREVSVKCILYNVYFSVTLFLDTF